MRLLLLHITGLAGEPLEELDGRTLLEASATPALDEIARRGSCGTVHLLPEGLTAGAGPELLALLGYLEDGASPPSLGALEAVAVGAPLGARDAAFRANLGSVGEDGLIADTGGGGAPEEDLLSLMSQVDEKLSTRRLRFYPGRAFAHVMVWTDGPTELQCTPAPLARGRPLESALPVGDGDGPLRQLIWDSIELLDRHRINHRRREEGLPPVNLLWPWAPGRVPDLEHHLVRAREQAAVLASRLEVLGAARAAGIVAHGAPRALAAGRAAFLATAAGHALTCLHLDLPEHFEHPTDPEAHQRAFEALDLEVVAPVLSEMRTSAESVRLILVGTWPETTWAPRPPALWGGWPPLRASDGIDAFSEAAARELGEAVAEPERLLREGRSKAG
ncbi:MAG: hypothetical protein FJX74_18840 [Armatimonadetes bacterium]|nr:hypothetical protein [Armatimonadota bacterium]